ncbi:MAG: hypothetical protein JSW23_00460 [Planctomycetota bacterium]|nr:MAG: hypothetical protein JSW23_00460 [Planctomycetota bacterium]
MWDKLGVIVGLLIGINLIIFRKRFVRIMVRKQLDERTTPRTKEYRHQLKEMKLEGVLHKGLEIAAIVFGVLLVLMSIPEFFPAADEVVSYILEFLILSLFAGCAAAIVELLVLFRFLWRKVKGYTQELYDDSLQSVQGSCGSDIPSAVRSVPTDDPVLRGLQRRAIVYTVICFTGLYVVFLVALYAIIRLTR